MARRSADHLQALVNERQATVRGTLDGLLNALAANDPAQVQAANASLSDALHALGGVVAEGDWPKWLKQLLTQVENYKANHANGPATWKAHLLTVLKYWPVVETYSWFTSDDESADFDIDAIIENVKTEFEIDSLFSKMVETLEKLAQCDDLDSVKACSDLERLIGILKRSKTGSFTSQITSWRFAKRFVANLVACYLKESKIAGPAIKAFEQTATELDAGFDHARDKIGETILELATSGFRSDALKNITAQELMALPDLRSSK